MAAGAPDLYAMMAELTRLQAPVGAEDAVRAWVLANLPTHLQPEVDDIGNVVVRLPGPGEGPLLTLAAHMDEIGMLVKRIEPSGRVRVHPAGGLPVWVWGEGPVTIRGRHAEIPGVLSFGAAHVSPESPHHLLIKEQAPVRWQDAWIETCRTPEDLLAAGIGPGARVVQPPHRTQITRLGVDDNFVAAHGLDDKAGIAVLTQVAHRLPEARRPVDLLFSVREEVLGAGVLRYARRSQPAQIVALEIMPVAAEYGLALDSRPVLTRADFTGPLSDRLATELHQAAAGAGIPLQDMIWASGGSDASKLVQMGLAAEAACLGWPTQNTHGYEIISLHALRSSADLLLAWLS
jgi:putative aminopeptidase FrvX